MKKIILITGSAGLIGSEAVNFFCKKDFDVVGIDNNMRAYFFGEEGSTKEASERNLNRYKNYMHFNSDIRDEKFLEKIFKEYKFDLIIHTAAQPSHDWAAKEPTTDFSINANGTLLLLENFRKYSPEAVFIFTSTNKVYGDTPNRLPLEERETRYEINSGHKYKNGISENMTLDNSTHSLFGVSKTAADLMVQEYGRYFNLRTGVFRCGCLTGSGHAGVEQHGFLSYLVKCIITGKEYTIFGYRGKQVRDNIHAYDLISAFFHFYQNPKYGEVYNIGGSRFANVSILEAIKKIESISGIEAKIEYVDKNRMGDHIWYISDVSKFKKDYPDWEYNYDIDATIEDICRNSQFGRKVFDFQLIRNLDYWKEKNWYYHNQLKQIFKDKIKENAKVLQVGYGLGDILAELYPKKAVSFDDNSEFISISRKRYSHIKFVNFDFNKYRVKEKFDYVIFPDSLEHLADIQTVLENVYSALSNNSKVVISSVNPRWGQIFWILEKLHLKKPEPTRNWLKLNIITNILEISGYKVMDYGFRTLIPLHIPLISRFINNQIQRSKIFSKFCVTQYIVAQKGKFSPDNNLTSSVIIPVETESESIKDCVISIPRLGRKTEILVVDGTRNDKVKNIVEQLSRNNKKIKYVKSEEGANEDSLRKRGIEEASGDIAVCYDELMSIPPIELRRFYNLLACRKGDFISGIRYVYPTQGQSLRQLNIIVNIIYSFIYSWLFKQKITDPLCSIKAFYLKSYHKSKTIKKITLLDLLINAVEENNKIREIPVHYKSDAYLTNRPYIVNRVLELSWGIFYAIWKLKIYPVFKRKSRFPQKLLS